MSALSQVRVFSVRLSGAYRMAFAVGQAVKAGGVSGVLVRQKDGDAWQVELSDGRKVWRPCRDLEPFAFGETVARPSDSGKQAPVWNAHLQKQAPKPGMFTCCAVRAKSKVPPVAASTPRSTKATAGTAPSLAERRAAEKEREDHGEMITERCMVAIVQSLPSRARTQSRAA